MAVTRTFLSFAQNEGHLKELQKYHDHAVKEISLPRKRDSKTNFNQNRQRSRTTLDDKDKQPVQNVAEVDPSLSRDKEAVPIQEAKKEGEVEVEEDRHHHDKKKKGGDELILQSTATTTNTNHNLSATVMGGHPSADRIAQTVASDVVESHLDNSQDQGLIIRPTSTANATNNYAILVEFKWNHDGNHVNISGTFADDWSYQIPMIQSDDDDDSNNNGTNKNRNFTYTHSLIRGQQYAYKFIVDGIWRIAPDQPTIADEFGNINNYIDLRDEQDKTKDSIDEDVDVDTASINHEQQSQQQLQQHLSTVTIPTNVDVKYPHIREFEKQDGAVIVTKLHGPHQLGLLRQSLCLLTKAYNSRMNYPIIAFTTMPINDTLIDPIREVVYPANLTVVIDNAGTLQKQVASLSQVRRDAFYKRCNVTNADNMTWWAKCDEERVGMNRIAYAWQAEFRTLHVWTHPILAQYKYMMWLDTDGFSTKVWDRDPIAVAMQNDLAIFFANWPQGRGRGEDAQDRIVRSLGQMLCKVKLKDGHLHARMGMNCPKLEIFDVHGFFHITNLDFYRSPKVQAFFKELIGDCFCCRRFDDQLAVTVPSAMLAGNRSWDMYSHDVKLDVYHNFDMDGKKRQRVGGFIKYWKKNGQTKFPEAYGQCKVTEGG